MRPDNALLEAAYHAHGRAMTYSCVCGAAMAVALFISWNIGEEMSWFF